MPHEPALVPMEDRNATLEMNLMDDFIRSLGHDPVLIRVGTGAEAHAILRRAAAHASEQLAQHECRAGFVQALHSGK